MGVCSQVLKTGVFLFLIFYFFGHAHGMWDLGSPTRDRTHAPCSGSAES